MGQAGCPKTSVRKYHCSLRNNPEESSSRLFSSLFFSRKVLLCDSRERSDATRNSQDVRGTELVSQRPSVSSQ